MKDNKNITQEETTNENVATIKQIFFHLLKWVGIVMCALSLIGFFISSAWINQTTMETIQEFGADDSDASALLLDITLAMLNWAVWLKQLPIAFKIIGIILGGLIWFSSDKE